MEMAGIGSWKGIGGGSGMFGFFGGSGSEEVRVFMNLWGKFGDAYLLVNGGLNKGVYSTAYSSTLLILIVNEER
jgi:hypothetical protein